MTATDTLDDIVALRRDLHAHPELRHEEHRTAGIVAEFLREWDIETHTGIGGTGVVGVVRAGTSPRAVLLRADMDALPMEEENTFGHRSRHAGKMHACGHDGHTAMLLAAARRLRQEGGFDGTVIFAFQPAEEGGYGARAMIDDGLFERFPCDAVFGAHNWPGMPAGSFGACAGPMMAGGSTFKVVITGKGGHAANPHENIDPLIPLFQLGSALQSVVSRNKRAIDAAVLSITRVESGSAFNVTPDIAWLGGTVRTYTDDVTDLIEQRMRDMVHHTAQAHGCTAELEFARGYPALVNSPRETAFALDVLREVVGASNVSEIEPVMPSEDFSYMLNERPGCYVFIGNGDGTHRDAGHGPGPCLLHNTSYDFNDALIPLGAEVWVTLARRYLAAA